MDLIEFEKKWERSMLASFYLFHLIFHSSLTLGQSKPHDEDVGFIWKSQNKKHNTLSHEKWRNENICLFNLTESLIKPIVVYEIN